MIWDGLNAGIGVLVAIFAAYKLVFHYDAFKPIERYGLSIIAGSVLLTIPPLLTDQPTPFDDWSPAALRLGLFLYLAGKVERLLRHARNNRLLIKRAQQGWKR